jgi:valyl-tRNA synthetase
VRNSGRPKEHRRLIPIITDEYPDPDFGSGAVKITGAHDFNDYQVALRNDIPMYRLMDVKGACAPTASPMPRKREGAGDHCKSGRRCRRRGRCINLVPDEYRGLDRFEARKRVAVVADIDAEGLRKDRLPWSRTRRSCSRSATARRSSSSRC